MMKLTTTVLLSSRLSDKRGFIVIEGGVNFAVVPKGKGNSLVSTVSQSGFVMERLSKDIVKFADGPVNLIEATDFPILFQKMITSNQNVDVYLFICIE